ncbi:MAG: hypothetical protein IPN90_03230 [Elusimicrobia bacterium]|nr:hypothetical protein [Elusimicrobiota bacterium]
MTSLFLLSFLAVRLSYSVRRLIELLGHVIPIAFFLAILLLVFGEVNINFGFDRSRGLILLAIPLAAATLGFLEYRLGLFSQVPSTQKVLALIFVAFPHVFAFGSNDNYLYRGSWAGLFWVMAGLIFIAPIVRSNKKWGILLPLSLATQLIAVLLLQGGMQNPYRQTGPLGLNKHIVEIGRPGAKVILSEGYANYIKGAVALAKEAGFKAGTPVIDLSGQSPGILYAMQAESIGQPWTIGGYPGSLNLATEALKRVPCEKIGKAWILAEPGGPRSLPAELLENFGGNMGDHYETVAFWDTARGSGGYEKRPPQLLLKSKREISTAVQACLDRKAEPQQ